MNINLNSPIFLSAILSMCSSFTALAYVDNNNCDLNELNQPYLSAYGPYDYTNPTHFKEKLTIVEMHHFSRNVEHLISGQSGSLSGDLGYTLHAFPNHHRALNAIAKLQRRASSELDFAKTSKKYTATCYFKRAIYFQPKDATSRMLFAIHLQLKKQYLEAEKTYFSAIEIQPNNPEIHYNLGLLYVAMGKITMASDHAQKAYAQGYPLQGLANKLELLKQQDE